MASFWPNLDQKVFKKVEHLFLKIPKFGVKKRAKKLTSFLLKNDPFFDPQIFENQIFKIENFRPQFPAQSSNEKLLLFRKISRFSGKNR